MSNNTNHSLGYEYLSIEFDLFNDLIKEICIVNTNNALMSIRSLHHIPGGALT